MPEALNSQGDLLVEFLTKEQDQPFLCSLSYRVQDFPGYMEFLEFFNLDIDFTEAVIDAKSLIDVCDLGHYPKLKPLAQRCKELLDSSWRSSRLLHIFKGYPTPVLMFH